MFAYLVVNIYNVWSIEKQKLIKGSVKDWLFWYKKILAVNDRYKLKLRSDYTKFNKLLTRLSTFRQDVETS